MYADVCPHCFLIIYKKNINIYSTTGRGIKVNNKTEIEKLELNLLTERHEDNTNSKKVRFKQIHPRSCT
jgi:hypothetical protein